MERSVRNRFAAFFSIIGLFFVYTGWKLAALIGGPAGATAAALVFVLLFGGQYAYRNSEHPSSISMRALNWTGSVIMGLWVTFVLLCLPFDSVRFVVWSAGRLTRLPPVYNGHVISFRIAAATGAAAIAMALVGFRRAVRGPIVRRVDIPVPGLPTALTSLRVVQFSDLHVGPTIQTGYIRRLVEQVNALDPDVVAFTGDLADGRPDLLEPYLEPLKALKARLGVFYVTGNHEYYWDAEEWIAAVRRLGWTPLINENRILTVGGKKILVGGVADHQADHFIAEHASSPVKAAETDERVDFKLLLAHRPDSAAGAASAGFDVMLCGHTHAGQFFPFSLLMPLTRLPYRGLHHEGDLRYYINAGTGYWGAVNRFAVPPEITSLRFRPA